MSSEDRRQQLDAEFARLFAALRQCEEGDAAGALSFAIAQAEHLVKYGEWGIALENLCDNLYEDGTIRSLPEAVYAQIVAFARFMSIDGRYYELLRGLVRAPTPSS